MHQNPLDKQVSPMSPTELSYCCCCCYVYYDKILFQNEMHRRWQLSVKLLIEIESIKSSFFSSYLSLSAREIYKLIYP